MKTLRANQRVYMTAKGALCAESDKDAAGIIATVGQAFPAVALEKFPNHSEFFEEFEADQQAPKARVVPLPK